MKILYGLFEHDCLMGMCYQSGATYYYYYYYYYYYCCYNYFISLVKIVGKR